LSQHLVDFVPMRGGAVEKHIWSIVEKLGVPPLDDDHRRVKAMLARLQP